MRSQTKKTIRGIFKGLLRLAFYISLIVLLKILINFIIMEKIYLYGYYIINLFILGFFLYRIVKLKIKEGRLEIAMDHYNIINALKDDKKDLVSNKVNFEQAYPKTVKLFNELQGPNAKERKEYYNINVARVLGEELYKAGAIKIEYIQGVEEDKILGEVRYLIEV